ncbi:hypothetical protein EYC80_008197 [Monilinia laxa]|uniref:Uncharacterized protein n=1 Tax=Monilinia laxa TaxID=61186 RepID=A0A5N6JTT2_MONLA|nr:hypothetical protein EYC80_008197 [Monilinia laxa]
MIKIHGDYIIKPEAITIIPTNPDKHSQSRIYPQTSRLPLIHHQHTLLFKMGSNGDFHASTGVTPPKGPVSYSTYKSPYGPKYKIQPHIAGWTPKAASKVGLTLAGFGASAGFFALFFFSDIPRVRNDIMVKIPIIGDRWRREIPASDNPF